LKSAFGGASAARIVDKDIVDKQMAFGRTLARIGDLLRPGLRCSFCRRRADDVTCLVAGASAYICDACVTKCVTVLEQQGGMAPTAPGR
jgi:ClpX C4-type zinc finger